MKRKKIMNRLIKTLIIVGISSIFWGCATQTNLQTGPYGGDTFLYNMDTTIVQTYNVLDNFLIWETANNTYIKANLPSVFNAANSIRVNTPLAISLINLNRNLYVSLKNSTNTVALAQASNSLQNAVVSFDNQLTNVSVVTVSTVTNTLSQVLTNTNTP